jgi:hypothetical protein
LNNIGFKKEKSMKKFGGLFLALVTSTLLMAGANTTGTLSKVADIPAKVCKEDRVYIEKDTNLMWQDQAYTEAENGAFKRQKSIEKAGSYRHAIRYCERLNYGGFSDWRLPTSDELTHVHSKEGQVFTYFRDNDFWSSTPTVDGKYYVVFPADAIRYARSPRQSNFVRCVRCIVEE